MQKLWKENEPGPFDSILGGLKDLFGGKEKPGAPTPGPGGDKKTGGPGGGKPWEVTGAVGASDLYTERLVLMLSSGIYSETQLLL